MTTERKGCDFKELACEFIPSPDPVGVTVDEVRGNGGE